MAKNLSDVANGEDVDDDDEAPVVVKRRKGGVRRTYTIPTDLQREGMAKKVTMYELSAKEEQQASARGMFNMVKATHEAAKASIGKFDGKRVDNSEGDVDEYWEACGPQVRALLCAAYEKMHGTDTKQEKSFFDSVEVEADGD